MRDAGGLKDGEYTVIGNALHTERDEALVLYHLIDVPDRIVASPTATWHGPLVDQTVSSSLVAGPLGGRWRHYKGGEYEVLGSAVHTETAETLVLYRALADESTLWARPAAMWQEPITHESVVQTRFARLTARQ